MSENLTSKSLSTSESPGSAEPGSSGPSDWRGLPLDTAPQVRPLTHLGVEPTLV